ncbi:MAG: aldo/keto reductase [Candidatus Thorarchaeota archaeon]
MEYVKLGKTGVKVSRVILGTMQMGWMIDEKTSFKILDRAIELGINAIDTADIYSKWSEESHAGKAEEIIGNWLRDRGIRDDIVLGTKVYGDMSEDINNKGLSRRHIHQAINGSLKRLQTDWIDVYFTHTFDADTPIEETLRTMTSLIEEGKVNYIGASNHPAWRLMQALWVSDKYNYASYQILQPVYNTARRRTFEQEIEPIVKEYDLGVTSYSPLGGGFLTGKYEKEKINENPRYESIKKRYFKDKNFEILKALKDLSVIKGTTMAQMALLWVLNKEAITAPIIGANSIAQLEEDIAALEVKLTENDLKILDEASEWLTIDELTR